MSTVYLEQLAQQLKVDKNAACRRAIERILARMKKRCNDGAYDSQTEAELAFRKFVDAERSCQKPKPAVKTSTRKPRQWLSHRCTLS